MSKKKPKSSAAENLIESLMDDLKDINAGDNFEGMPLDDGDEHRVENTGVNAMWTHLENNFGPSSDASEEIDYSEFSGGAGNSDNDEYDSSKVSESEEHIPESDFDMPVGFGELPASEQFAMPSAQEDAYQGRSADGGYQSSDDLDKSLPEVPSGFDPDYSPEDDDSTKPVMGSGMSPAQGGEDKTVSLQQDLNLSSFAGNTAASDAEKTVAVDGFANARLGVRRSSADVDVKVSVGNFRGSSRGSANVMTSVDASLAQAENLKIAQQRILELEREVESLRADNEELASAGEIIRSRTDELGVRITAVEKEKAEDRESFQSEILILKGNLQYKENEVAKARIKVDELETRLKSDFKKIRVRERELENRLELLRAEKSALVRSKDEYILDQKRKIDQLSSELDNYRKKCLELNKTIEANQDQVKRTERALRLALTNLEAKEENLVPLKKAE